MKISASFGLRLFDSRTRRIDRLSGGRGSLEKIASMPVFLNTRKHPRISDDLKNTIDMMFYYKNLVANVSSIGICLLCSKTLSNIQISLFSQL